MAKLLCVYCSSSDRIDRKYLEAARRLGEEMVRRGWNLVYGGGRTGLMGELARAVQAGGGRVIGVIPEFMKVRELAFDEADELVTVVTMRERKLLMESRADAFLALPGGWGTLEEILEILALRQLEVVRKPCVVFNQDGFYDDLLRQFRRMRDDGFFLPSNFDLFRVTESIDAIFPLIEPGSEAIADPKWHHTGGMTKSE